MKIKRIKPITVTQVIEGYLEAANYICEQPLETFEKPAFEDLPGEYTLHFSIRWKPPARDDFKVYVNSTSDIKKLINETSAGEE